VEKVTVRFVVGAAKQHICRMSADLHDGDRVVIEHGDGDLYAAITRASARLGQSTSRSIRRTRAA
jgi:hypothetical protein